MESPPANGESSRSSRSSPTLPNEPPEDIDDRPSKETKRLGNESGQNEDNVLWVDWEGPNDPSNPKNWSHKRKWVTTIIVSSFTIITPVSSSMIAPAIEQVAQEFQIKSSFVAALTISIFILGYCVGPLVIGPLSEIFGRSRVLQLSNLWYLAWNIGCGFAKNESELIAFRLLAGIGGSAPLAIGGGVLGDVWRPEERGKAVTVYSLAPLLGPVIGPACSGWVAERSTWRWVFYAPSIVDVFVQILGIFLLRETFAPVLLERKANKIRKNLDAEKGSYKYVRTIYEANDDRTWRTIFGTALVRPFQLFSRESIAQVMGVYMAFIYGIFYLFLTTIPAIFSHIYNDRPGIVGLHYIALGIGVSAASQANAQFIGKIYVYYKKKNGNVGEPEFRLPPMVPGTILLPFGLLLTGWSAQNHLHWIATDIGIAFIGAGITLSFQSTQMYVIDTFTLYAASALAAINCLRALAGFSFPLFAPIMYEKLGYGKGNTLLACLAIGLGCPAPLLLWRYGKRIRMRSKYAHKPQIHGPAQPKGGTGESEKK